MTPPCPQAPSRRAACPSTRLPVRLCGRRPLGVPPSFTGAGPREGQPGRGGASTHTVRPPPLGNPPETQPIPTRVTNRLNHLFPKGRALPLILLPEIERFLHVHSDLSRPHRTENRVCAGFTHREAAETAPTGKTGAWISEKGGEGSPFPTSQLVASWCLQHARLAVRSPYTGHGLRMHSLTFTTNPTKPTTPGCSHTPPTDEKSEAQKSQRRCPVPPSRSTVFRPRLHPQHWGSASPCVFSP